MREMLIRALWIVLGAPVALLAWRREAAHRRRVARTVDEFRHGRGEG
jgi:hypothetical protein